MTKGGVCRNENHVICSVKTKSEVIILQEF